MYKQLLLQTMPPVERLNVEELLLRSGVNEKRFVQIIDPNDLDDVTKTEYIAIAKALPASIGKSIKSLTTATEELEYLEVQLETLALSSNDKQLPLFYGMSRLVRRVIKAL